MNNYNETMNKPHVTPAQWEQRRYEIAKAVFGHNKVTAVQAVEAADALIAQLKGGES